jgi:outer membrane protein OmpA-like peptidoglycan-associated protein/opacity protein-like surface antigen
MKRILLLLLSGFLFLSLSAQVYDAETYKDFSHWSVALHVGGSQLDGDISQSSPLIPGGGVNLTLGVSVENTISPLHGIGFEYLFAPYSGTDATPAGYTLNAISHQGTLYWAVNLTNWLQKQRKSNWNVYARLGAGIAYYNATITNPDGSAWTTTHPIDENVNSGWAIVFPLGLSAEYNISKSLALGARLDYRTFNKDNLDGAHRQNYQGVTNDYLTVGTIELRYKFGATVKPHTRNLCLQEYESAALYKAIDKKLAAADSALAKKLQELGDKEKQMKDLEPRLSDLEGRLKTDTDGDGVPDYLDKCPNTPTTEKVDANGCPSDRDGDGVADFEDKCPDVKGSIAKNGCGGITDETQNILDKALRGIYFETNKDIIKNISYSILNNVATIMIENPSYKLQINGHTDGDASAEYNQVLSEKRAEAVKKYLINKGVAASRLKAAGFGESKPVSDNNTAAGKALNRRVEFVVFF